MDFIGFVVKKFRFYDVFIQYVQNQGLSKLPMFDLCSGSGEPARYIFQETKAFSSLILSDKYPSENSIEFQDVLNMNFEKNNYYTMFNAFHHFTDAEKIQVLTNIKNAGAKALFVEILEPSILFVLKVSALTIVANLFITPFIKPFSFMRLFLTYIIPINIFTITYDGIISVLKSRSVKQYREILPTGVNVFSLKKRLSSLVVIEIK